MLEILAVIWLCNINSKNAISRGRKPSLFIFLTIFLWVICELVGGGIGSTLGLEIWTYIIALVFAILGGFVSYLIAKNCKQGNYVPPVKEKKCDKYQQNIGFASKYCENCGAKLDEGSVFCYNCGAKVPESAQIEVFNIKENEHEIDVLRSCSKAPYMLGYSAIFIWFVIFSLHFIKRIPLGYVANSSVVVSFTALACSAFLIWKKGLLKNVSSIIFSVFFAITNVINPVLNLMSQKNLNLFKFSDFGLYNQYGRRIIQTMVVIVVAYGISILLKFLFKNKENKADSLFAIIFSGAIFIVKLLFDIRSIIYYIKNRTVAGILSVSVTDFIIFVAVLITLLILSYTEKISDISEKNKPLGVIWCILCIMGNIATAVLGILDISYISSYAFVMSLIAVTSFAFLLSKKKYAFSLIAVYPLLNVIIQISSMVTYSSSFSGSRVTQFILTLSGAVANIFITWLLLIKERKN